MINMNKIANYIVCLAAVALSAGCASGPDFKTYGSTLNPPFAFLARSRVPA
jgi:hypothetical protein